MKLKAASSQRSENLNMKLEPSGRRFERKSREKRYKDARISDNTIFFTPILIVER